MSRRIWLPPAVKLPNESAGYLGYYTRTHCPEYFDLIDLDGSDPTIWFYRKSETKVRRVFEEKPSHHRQQLRESERRVLHDMAATWARRGSSWVIWRAERLEHAEFPITLWRLGSEPGSHTIYTFDRKEDFDKFLLDGLIDPPPSVPSIALLDPDLDPYSTVLHWLRGPWSHRDDQDEIDALVSQLAAIIRRPQIAAA